MALQKLKTITLLILAPFILAVATATATATEPEGYLPAGQDFVEEVSGNGYERGFEFSLRVLLREDRLERPFAFVENDRAGCTPSQLHLVDVELAPGSPPERPYYFFDFEGRIETSVWGDSGGCIVLIRKSQEPTSEILKIILYQYITDY